MCSESTYNRPRGNRYATMNALDYLNAKRLACKPSLVSHCCMFIASSESYQSLAICQEGNNEGNGLIPESLSGCGKYGIVDSFLVCPW